VPIFKCYSRSCALHAIRHNSEQGEYYERVNTQFDVFYGTKKSTVIVLGVVLV
jgi:hypothetical protein